MPHMFAVGVYPHVVMMDGKRARDTSSAPEMLTFSTPPSHRPLGSGHDSFASQSQSQPSAAHCPLSRSKLAAIATSMEMALFNIVAFEASFD